jgi:hypothetical protein
MVVTDEMIERAAFALERYTKRAIMSGQTNSSKYGSIAILSL